MAIQNPTANYEWTLPIIGGNPDAWGTILNTILGDDATGVDAVIKALETASKTAAHVTSGTFHVDRIPNLAASKITAGTFPAGSYSFQGVVTLENVATPTIRLWRSSGGDRWLLRNNSDTLQLINDMTGGVFAVARTGDVSWSGALTGGSVPAARVDSGVLAVARIPDLNASKITAGTFGSGDFSFLGAADVHGPVRVFSGGTFRGGLGTSTWALGDGQNDVALLSDASLKFVTDGVLRATLHASGAFSVVDNIRTLAAFALDAGGTFRGGLFPYQQVLGSGTDRSPTIFSETDIYFAVNGSATRRARLGTVGLVVGADAHVIAGAAHLAIKGTDPFYSFHGTDGARLGFIQMRAANTMRIGLEVNQGMEFWTNSTARLTIAAGGAVTAVSSVTASAFFVS